MMTIIGSTHYGITRTEMAASPRRQRVFGTTSTRGYHSDLSSAVVSAIYFASHCQLLL